VRRDDPRIVLADDDRRDGRRYRSTVFTRLRRLLARYAVDLAVSALALASLIEDLALPVTTLQGRDYDRAPEWLVVIVVCAIPVLVALRRRIGIAGPLAAIVLAGLTAIPAPAWVPDSAFMFFLVILVSGVSGYMASRPLEYASIALILVVGALAVARQPDRSWGTLFFVLVVLALAWVVGAMIRRPVAKAQAAEERALRLEQAQAFAARAAVSEERQRIARELHDVIAHSVSVMTVQTGAVRRLLRPEQEKERQALLSVEETGREALTEMRRLVGLLKEDSVMPEYTPQPSLATLGALLETVRDAGLPVELTVEGTPRELPPGVDLSAFRVVQEALTNALKYAGPARAWVTVRWRDDSLELEVANDGKQTSETNGTGHGLVGMRERVSLVGGTIESGEHPVNGFVVKARLPLEAAT
jgi:signal transduction histidine kinase